MGVEGLGFRACGLQASFHGCISEAAIANALGAFSKLDVFRDRTHLRACGTAPHAYVCVLTYLLRLAKSSPHFIQQKHV